MEAQIKAAIAQRNYPQTSRLLKQWHASDPDNALILFYAAQLQERTGRLEAAESNYLKLLKRSPTGKLMAQARKGLQRIRQQQQAAKAQALTEARHLADGQAPALLAIAAPAESQRQQAIAALAQVFSLNAYTARLIVPNSGFRLYRIGPWGELQYYAQALKDHPIQVLGAKVSSLAALETFQICYFETLEPNATVICKNSAGELGRIPFDWAEVSQQVSGQLPIFEQVVDLGPWQKLAYKEQVQDYALVRDLHLRGRQIILRLCDRLYDYQQGVALSRGPELNSRIQWNHLLVRIDDQMIVPRRSDFTRFGKSALELIPLLPPVDPQLRIHRRNVDRCAPHSWDIAFHLYSGLCYLHPDH